MDQDQVTVGQMLAGLDILQSGPLAPSVAEIPGHDPGRWASHLISAPVAENIWLQWNPDRGDRIKDSHFLEHFRRFLANGVALGYRLNRFRDISGRLPDPDKGARNWIPSFEEAIAGEDCCVIRMFLSRDQYEAFLASNQEPPAESETWDGSLSMMADGLFYELGLVFRPATIAVDDSLPSAYLRCEWNDLRLPPQRGLDDQSVLVNDTVDRLSLLKINGEEAVNPANGSECAIIDKSCEGIARQAGLTTWDSRGYAVIALSSAIRRAAAALVNRSVYDLYILRLRDFNPDLVSVLQSALEPNFVVQILRGLLAEEISIRDLSTIIEAALELRSTVSVDTNKYIVFSPPTGGVFLDSNHRRASDLLPADYVEFIRARLKRYISYKYTHGGGTLGVYLMDPHSEQILARPGELDARVETSIIKAVREEIGGLPPTAQYPVILTTLDVRRRLHRLVSLDFPHLAVLSYQELSPDMNIQPIARITPRL